MEKFNQGGVVELKINKLTLGTIRLVFFKRTTFKRKSACSF